MAAARIKTGTFMTDLTKLKNGIWPWESGVRARFPDHFKKTYIENFTKEPTPVHYRPDPAKYRLDKYGVRHRVQNFPVPVIFPEQALRGIWGGEGVIQGTYQPKNNKYCDLNVRIWKPNIMKRIFYSEILNKWMAISVTYTTLEKIDEAYGFDSYILKTHSSDLQSRLGMRLKRAMLLKLAQRDLYPDDPEKNKELLEKYREYIIPEEEADWVGLTMEEAEIKQEALEEKQRKEQTRPLKEVYMEELLRELEHDKYDFDGSQGWLSKLNPFHSDKPSA